MVECIICDWFDKHIKIETDKIRLQNLKVSKNIHKNSNEHPTTTTDSNQK